MKTTYLIYKQIDGTQQLVKATQEEWNAILDANKGLSMKERRLFIKDCFDDGKELDCMYIEASREDYGDWHNSIRTFQRSMEISQQYQHLSLDAPTKDTEVSSLHEVVGSGFSLEEMALDNVLLDELKAALTAWKPWACELLELYMNGKGRSCTSSLCEKYHMTDRAIQKRKVAFEKFILKFLHKNLFETTTVNGKMRIFVDSFEQWYNSQLRYRKVNEPEPAMLEGNSMTLKEFAEELGISESTALHTGYLL